MSRGSLAPVSSQDGAVPTLESARAIEVDFPIGEISQLAERESYRKEVFRPIYHIHKWWANRLGSVFRAIVLGALADKEQDIWEGFYKTHDFSDKVVLDPFMGSGTTLGEAAKLGAKTIGCDINPISTFAVRQALTRVDIDELENTFRRLESAVQPQIARYYVTLDPESGETVPVLYYFWVKQVTTPEGEEIPLFSSYVFSKNAYPKRKPNSKIVCPLCWAINTARYDAEEVICGQCSETFNPQHGPVSGAYVIDSAGQRYKIRDLLPEDGSPPSHKLYAIMALRSDGTKIYLASSDYDHALIAEAKEHLQREDLPLPTMPVRPGHNTDQARKYNYSSWRDFFNDRQLLSLGLLLRQILEIENEHIRDQFICLFSSTLEFNNLFCSFKGEGTGAVRHMFSNHILNPERTPLENIVWGTSKSSGTFSTLFRSRLLKAKVYLDTPTEILLDRDVFGNLTASKSTPVAASEPIQVQLAETWDEFTSEEHRALVLNGDSATLPIPDESVDAVVTDPPYFDFVHYSELSDFFFAWLAPVLSARYPFFARQSSQHDGEVQSKDPQEFATSLSRVFRECHRVLKDEGVLSFSFHHSRPEGWAAIYSALRKAGFYLDAVHPVHAEMKVASPKSSAKSPISLDIILVCKKRESARHEICNGDVLAERSIKRLEAAGVILSSADLFNIRISAMLAAQPTNTKLGTDYKEILDHLTLERLGNLWF